MAHQIGRKRTAKYSPRLYHEDEIRGKCRERCLRSIPSRHGPPRALVNGAAGGDQPDLLDPVTADADIPVVKVDGRVAVAGNEPHLGAISAGAICGAFVLPAAAKLGADRGETEARLGTAAGPLPVCHRSQARNRLDRLCACRNFSGCRNRHLERIGQFALTAWVRGRGMAMFAAQEGVFAKTFHIDSWLDHMRQHQRVTNADRVLQDAVHRFDAQGDPAVRHLIAAERNEKS